MTGNSWLSCSWAFSQIPREEHVETRGHWKCVPPVTQDTQGLDGGCPVQGRDQHGLGPQWVSSWGWGVQSGEVWRGVTACSLESVCGGGSLMISEWAGRDRGWGSLGSLWLWPLVDNFIPQAFRAWENTGYAREWTQKDWEPLWVFCISGRCYLILVLCPA